MAAEVAGLPGTRVLPALGRRFPLSVANDELT